METTNASSKKEATQEGRLRRVEFMVEQLYNQFPFLNTLRLDCKQVAHLEQCHPETIKRMKNNFPWDSPEGRGKKWILLENYLIWREQRKEEQQMNNTK